MKKILLILFTLLGFATTVMSQSWPEPVEPALPELRGAAPESGKSYYIRNVGAGLFMTGSNEWATQISLSKTDSPYLKVKMTSVSNSWINPASAPDKPATGWELSLDGTHYFSGDWDGGSRTDYAVAGGSKLFRNYETTGWVDLGTQNRGFIWTLAENENGYYYMQCIDGDPNFPNAKNECCGVPADATNAPNAEVMFNLPLDPAANWVEWEFIPLSIFTDYDAAMEIYRARVNLYQQLLVADQYEANTSEAGAVYNNSDATADEINAATTALRSEIRRALLVYASKNASPSNPIDLTEYVLVNPNFSTSNLNGWTISEASGNRQFNNGTYTNEAENIKIQGFMETWVAAPAHLDDLTASQQVEGLPDGHYILECDAVALNQTAYDDPAFVEKDDYTGAYLFCRNGALVLKSQALASDREARTNPDTGEQTNVWLPAHFSFGFDLTNANVVSLGYMTEGTNLNWIAADNFRLIALGAVQAPPAYTALLTEISTSNTLLEQRYTTEAEAATYEALSAALNEVLPLAEEAASFDKVAEYEAAYAKLNQARTAVQASIAAYARLDDFIARLNKEHDTYTGSTTYKTLCDMIDALLEQMEDGKTDATLTAAEINDAINGFDAKIKDTIREIFETAAAEGKQLDEPLDITSLFDHMSYAYGTTQTAFAGGYPAENPVWMNETGTGNFKTAFSTAEVWGVRPFNIYRDFTGLAKGQYTIQTHAFYRTSGNAYNYEDWQRYPDLNDECEYAYIYAGSIKSPLHNIAEIAGNVNVNGDTNVGTEDDPIYIINNQQGASMIWTLDEYADKAEKTLVEASSVVTQDGGTLRVGIAGTEALMDNQWVVWYSWKLFYNGGISSSALDEELSRLLDQAAFVDTWGVEAGDKKIEDATAAGKAALATTDEAVKNAAIAQLKEAFAYAEKSKELVETIYMLPTNYYNMINEKLSDYVFTDTRFIDLLEAVDAANAEVLYPSNEQIEQWIADLEALWPEYLLSNAEMDKATPDNPVDMNILLVNPTFDNNNKDGWTIEITSYGGSDGSGVAEFWGCSPFDMYQIVKKLKPGYWRLDASAFFRAGGTADEINAISADNDAVLFNEEYLYATGNTFDVATKVHQWIDFNGGAILNTPENQDLIGKLAQKDSYRVTLNGEEVEFFSANSKDVLNGFFSIGQYLNTVDFGYTEEDGPVRIGLKLLESVDKCWCPFDNFKLSYLGTTAPDAIENLNADVNRPAAKAIYGIDGRQRSTLTRGINIVRRADGTVQKVLVK